jgi:hypothetical protein
VSQDRYLTESDIADYELVSPMLDSLHREMSELSKKKQDGLLNKLKIRHVNRILEKVKSVLADDPSVEYLEILDEDEMPQNSDAVLILGQWRAAMNQFRAKNTYAKYGEPRWRRGAPDEDTDDLMA